LWLFNGTDFVFTKHLKGGTTFSFGKSGVARFRILGIEDSLNIDPANATAFITGLTFVSDGKFTGSMTPIINLPEIAGDWSVDDIETLSAKGLGEETRTANGIVRFSFTEASSGTIELDFDPGGSTDVTYTGPFTLNREGTKVTWGLDEISLQDYQAYLREWFADLALATRQINDKSDVSDFQLTKTTFKPISVSKKSQSPVDMTIKTTGIATGIFGGKQMTIKFSHNGIITFIEKNF